MLPVILRGSAQKIGYEKHMRKLNSPYYAGRHYIVSNHRKPLTTLVVVIILNPRIYSATTATALQVLALATL